MEPQEEMDWGSDVGVRLSILMIRVVIIDVLNRAYPSNLTSYILSNLHFKSIKKSIASSRLNIHPYDPLQNVSIKPRFNLRWYVTISIIGCPDLLKVSPLLRICSKWPTKHVLDIHHNLDQKPLIARGLFCRIGKEEIGVVKDLMIHVPIRVRGVRIVSEVPNQRSHLEGTMCLKIKQREFIFHSLKPVAINSRLL